MKKLIALMLGLVMMFSLSTTAFAVGEKTGTTTLTVTVPEPSYTMHIPADMMLEYGNDEVQNIGSVYVSDLVNVNRRILVTVNTSNLTNGSSTIPVTYYESSNEPGNWTEHANNLLGVYNRLSSGEMYTSTWYIGAKIDAADWTSATPGTYTATLNFTFSFAD